MPVRKYVLSKVARGMRAFLSLEAGVTRDGELDRLRQLVAARDRQLAQLQAGGGDGAAATSVRPGNFVWIFGDGRTGSTWLMRMIEELEDQTLWREPMVGLLFGYLYYLWSDQKRYATRHFIFGRDRESWIRSIRNFVLDEASTRFPDLGEGEYLVVKEPNGSIGAPLLMEALPESRMILLVRDPRDVVASALDAHKKGSWVHDRMNVQGSPADEQPDAFVESRALKYLWYVGNSKVAYDAHSGPKVLVRYEELRANTLGEMRRIYKVLGIEVDDEELERAVQRHAWENVPEERKGEGKFHRKATPGGWREDLTPEQAKIIEGITAPLLKEFYSYEGESGSLSEALASDLRRRELFLSPTP